MTTAFVRWAGVHDDDRLLTGAERRRAAAMGEADRRRFVTGRDLLRRTVAAVAGCHPADVEVEQTCTRCGGPHGRPAVHAGGRALGASVAHAGELAVVAVATRAVGVDVEPGADRRWVRTEAVLKATGHGLEVDPSLVGVSAPGDPPRLLSWQGPGRRPRLRIVDLDPCDGYVGALAVRSWRLRVDAALSFSR